MYIPLHNDRKEKNVKIVLSRLNIVVKNPF